jgi:S1-C subfamily serine protease
MISCAVCLALLVSAVTNATAGAPVVAPQIPGPVGVGLPEGVNSPNSNPPAEPGIGSLQDYLQGDNESISLLGIVVQADQRALSAGGRQSGLLVLSVDSHGPAAKAGLSGWHHRVKTLLEIASIAGAFFVPPVEMLVPVLESTQAGEDFFLIVGVDGYRVTDLINFEEALRDVQPGEIVYLSVVHNGRREQLSVPLPNQPQLN